MPGDIQRLGDERPLERDVFRGTRAEALIQAPADRAVIHDRVVASCESAAIDRLSAEVPGPVADEAHDGVLRTTEPQRELAQADAFARSRLAGHGHVRCRKSEPLAQRDQAGDIENNSARAGGFFDGVAQSSGNRRLAGHVIREGVHPHNAAAASAARESSPAFRARKRQMPWAKIPDGAWGRVAHGVDDIYAPEIGRTTHQGRCARRWWPGSFRETPAPHESRFSPRSGQCQSRGRSLPRCLPTGATT